MNRCITCGENKTLDSFSRDRSKKRGHKNVCKSCINKRAKLLYPTIIEKSKQYYKENRNRILEQKKQYHQKYRSKHLKYRKQYYQENQEKLLEQSKQYYIQNKEKRKGYRLKHDYNISYEEYNTLKQLQNGKCKICEKKYLKKTLHVDHCHKTGRIRGLLCHHCNVGIGNLRDSVEILKKAIMYLENGDKQ